MQKDAEKAAKAANVKLTVAAGKQDGDTQSQIGAVQNAIARGDKGILITTNGDAVNAALNQAKQKGIFVIALDTALNPANTADITFATDNFQAGKLIGQYGAKKLNGKKAVIAMLDLFNNQVVSVDIQRDHGFLTGMGINPGSTTQNGKEATSGKYSGGDYTIACHQPTQGAIDGGRTAMETCLSKNSNINVVYAINEPAAEGAYNALKAQNKQNDVTVLAIDGSCQGLGFVDSGEFAADSAQYPGRMASLGVAAIAKLARGGAKPTTTSGKDFFDTGTNLVTKSPHLRRGQPGRRHREEGVLGEQLRHSHGGGAHAYVSSRRRVEHGHPGRTPLYRPSSTVPSSDRLVQEESVTTSIESPQSAEELAGDSNTFGQRVHEVLHRYPALSPAVVLVLGIIVFSFLSDRFFRLENFSLMTQIVSYIGVLAVGQTLIILTAGIDLSIGAVMVLSSFVMAKMVQTNQRPRRRSPDRRRARRGGRRRRSTACW